jgi:hypothetical protein
MPAARAGKRSKSTDFELDAHRRAAIPSASGQDSGQPVEKMRIKGKFLSRRRVLNPHKCLKMVDSCCKALLLLSSPRARGRCENSNGEAVNLERLYSVYKVENGELTLLGGLVERRESRRRESNRRSLEEMAKRKFATSPDDELEIVLLEEK